MPNNVQAALAANAAAGTLIRAQGLRMQTPVGTQVLSASANNAGMQLNFIPRNVGLVTGFWVEGSAQIKNNNASAAITPTALNVANFFSNITFVDLTNTTRINCSGASICLLDTTKERKPFAVADLTTGYDTPVKYGANSTATVQSVATTNVVWSATSSIASGATGVVTFIMWIPMAYSDLDFRGAYYANVINGQANLQLTVNPSPAFASGGDQMLTMYGTADSSTSVQILNTTVKVTQQYYDQLPVNQGQVILPQRDISKIYMLLDTTFSNMVPANDFPMPYPNFREIISSTVRFDTLTTLQSVPNFVNYFSLQAANATNIFQRDGALNAALTRNTIGTDFPTGIAYFSYRDKPLSTTQYGNLQLIFNPNSNWSASYAAYHFWEMFADVAVVTQLGSVAANA